MLYQRWWIMKVYNKDIDINIKVGNLNINQNTFSLIAGPCSVESSEMLNEIVDGIDSVDIIRGGAFKPRTSPYDFQGLKEDGIKYLIDVKNKVNKPIVSEIMSIDQIKYFDDVDIIQIGARNMQNFELLKAVGHLNKPILLKRGLGNTIAEFIASAEYIISTGNNQVILCERGIRTFEVQTRFTLDIAAIELIKQQTNLPIFIDPSHASGDASLVESLSLAAVAAGCNGLMIEVHNNPKLALSDANQQLEISAYNKLVKKIQLVYNAIK